jgi:hypothetical protein
MSGRRIDPAVVCRLWDHGATTEEIALFFGSRKREAEVYNLLWRARERRRQAKQRLARSVARSERNRDSMGIATDASGPVSLPHVSIREVA